MVTRLLIVGVMTVAIDFGNSRDMHYLLTCRRIKEKARRRNGRGYKVKERQIEIWKDEKTSATIAHSPEQN